MAIGVVRPHQLVVGILRHAENTDASELFFQAFNRSLAIPMRLPTAIALLLATGVYTNHPPTWEVALVVMLGGFVGIGWWWGQLFVLTALFAKRVPEPITVRSLNKIRPFCGVLLGILAVVALLLL